MTAVLKNGDHVQNNHPNLLPWASFHNLASLTLPICSKIKSDVPWRSPISPEVLKLRAFRQTSYIFLTAQKRAKQSIPATQLAISCLWIARGITSSPIFSIVYLMKSETTQPRHINPQQHIAHAFSKVSVSLFDCGAKIRRNTSKPTTQTCFPGLLFTVSRLRTFQYALK